MDQELLVSNQQIGDGEALLAKLIGSGFDVTVAFWAKISDGGLWYLFIGTTSLESLTSAGAWRALSQALRQVQPRSITISEIKLVPPTDPIALEAIEHRDESLNDPILKPRNLPLWVMGWKLGDLNIESAYIYPHLNGKMSRDQVVQSVAALMSRAGAQTPSSITLRDGSSIQAVPTSIQLSVPGGLQIVLHDLAGKTDRTVSVDEVLSIR